MRWFAGSALLLVIALVFELGLLAYAMYVLLAIMLLGRWISHAWAAGLVAERECNRLEANVGDTVAVVVTLVNRGRLPVGWALLEDMLPPRALFFEPPSLKLQGSRMQLVMLRRGGLKTMMYQVTCNRRGYYQLGPMIVETGDLLGLHRRFRVLTRPEYLMVYPKIVPLAGFGLSSKRPIGEVRMTYRLFEDPTRIGGVRPYERGDPLNRVHWRATARTGELHSKVYEPSTVIGATILLDFHQESFPKHNEPHRSELAVTAAASLANAVYELGQQVGLVTNGHDAADRVRREGWSDEAPSRRAARHSAGMLEASDRLRPQFVATRRGPEQLMRILTTLARAELSDGLRFPELVQEANSRLPRDATVVALLTTVTRESAIALGNLRRRGFAVTALVSVYEPYEFAKAAEPLLAEGVEVRHLKDEAGVATVCEDFLLHRAPQYSLL